MRRVNQKVIFGLMIFGIICMLYSGCKKDDENPIDLMNNMTYINFNQNLIYGTMTDQEGNVYKTIKIDDQIWMAENLRTTKYRNGDHITQVKSNEAWLKSTTEAYCNYNNTKSLDTIATFGRLYNYYAVTDSRNIAPEGWHVPTDSDWNTLISYLGDGSLEKGDTIAGAYLKEAGNSNWAVYTNANPVVDNRSGFTAIPAGWRALDGFGQTVNAMFWIYPEFENTVWIRSLINGFPIVPKTTYNNLVNLGLSIRCIKNAD